MKTVGTIRTTDTLALNVLSASWPSLEKVLLLYFLAVKLLRGFKESYHGLFYSRLYSVAKKLKDEPEQNKMSYLRVFSGTEVHWSITWLLWSLTGWSEKVSREEELSRHTGPVQSLSQPEQFCIVLAVEDHKRQVFICFSLT